jgi:zinc finger SWIM domain-containing protein 3
MAFACDPVRSNPITVDTTDIRRLSQPAFLSTALIDFILQRSLNPTQVKDFIFATSNCKMYFDMENTKVDSPLNANSVAKARQRYRQYSSNPFRLVAANCNGTHFFVIDVTFDIRHPKIFQRVVVYDSWLPLSSPIQKIDKDDRPADCLRQLQLFLSQYCFYDHPQNKILQTDPMYILKEAYFAACPQQRNDPHCGIFAVANILHLVHGIPIDTDIYNIDHVKTFRAELHELLTNEHTTGLTPEVARNFFPMLQMQLHNNRDSPAVAVAPTATSTSSEKQEPNQLRMTINHETAVQRSLSPSSLSPSPPSFEDHQFRRMFIANDTTYANYEQIAELVEQYQILSGFRLAIRRVQFGGKLYFCASHRDCCFRAKFGKVFKSDFLKLKPSYSKPFHSGELLTTTADGRAPKSRASVKVRPVVDTVAMVKHDKPQARDIMKAAANTEGIQATYQQSYRAIQKANSENFMLHQSSFQLLLPYLQRFHDSNPGSKTVAVRDDNNNIQKIFICPGIMDHSIKFVRPVMSLDAAHLKGEWKGMLYTASVKSACDELYLVAFALMSDNENASSWRWFLENLSSALPTLSSDHPHPQVQHKLFTFVSDRQKGLIEALSDVFPSNHSTYCAVHIARNVERAFGKKAAKYVFPLAKSFGSVYSHALLDKVTPNCRQYLNAIPASQWRSDAWIADPSLPPRYGIRTSNMSESMNSMFLKAREGSWLFTVNNIVTTMYQRISQLREIKKGNTGVVDKVKAIISHRWQNCAGFKVVNLEDRATRFVVTRLTQSASEEAVFYNVDVENRFCECGEWQDNGFPCIDAIAYFRLHKQMGVDNILSEEVNKYYTYDNELALLERNIQPVCIQVLSKDGVTLPPNGYLKRSTGRPKTKRLRTRSPYKCGSEMSKRKCKLCHKTGHNSRTCAQRQALAVKNEDRNSIPDMPSLE